jgi:CCDC81-like prokaryotic HU domain 1/CCDC81-like prokaryotic HU domain 2
LEIEKKVLMSIDIAKYVSELLYEHDSVIIPELGGIVASYKPASIDRVQGLIHPPSKKLSFNKNLLLDDGILVDYIKRKNNISFKESVDIIAAFVAETKEKLNDKEIIILPQIGRLYKDYENNLRFLQDTTNFNTDVFGLPALQFYPILRSQEMPIKKIKPVKLVSKRRKFEIQRSFSKKIASVFLPIFFGLVITVFAIGIYKKQKNEIPDNSIIQRIPINENRINKKPSIDNLSFFEGISSTDEVENKMMEELDQTAEIASRRATILEEQKKCVIIIGVFSKKAGVEKRVRDIFNLGYVAYQDKIGALNRVGVQFAYEQESEIKNMLKILREKFDSHAWILKE